MATYYIGFYHSEKLQSTKTHLPWQATSLKFYHSEKLQSTKTDDEVKNKPI